MKTIIIENENCTAVFSNATDLHVMPLITCFTLPIAETTNINPLVSAVKDGIVQSFSMSSVGIRVSVRTKYIVSID